MKCEENTKLVARKNLVASTDLKKGKVITYDDIEALRPNINGMSPMNIKYIIGKKLIKDMQQGELFSIDIMID